MDAALPALEDDTFRRVPPPRVREALSGAGLTLVGPGPAPGWMVRSEAGSELLVSLAVGTVRARGEVAVPPGVALHPVLDVLPAGDDEVLVHPALAGRRLRTIPALGAGVVRTALVAAAQATATLHEAGLSLGAWELGDVLETTDGGVVVWVPSPGALDVSGNEDARGLLRDALALLACHPDDEAATALRTMLDRLPAPTPEAIVGACQPEAGVSPAVDSGSTGAPGLPSMPERRALRRGDLARLRRQPRPPRRAVAGVVAAGLAAGALGGAALGRALQSETAAQASVPRSAPGVPTGRSSLPGGDPAQAAQTLTATRVAVLAEADAAGDRGVVAADSRTRLRAALAAIHAPDSALARADDALLRDLLAGTADVEHVAAQARSGRVIAAGDRPVVEVVYAMAARDGTLHERVAVLRLSSEEGGWRVAEVVAEP